jgi:pimeloyl-ACP methyl ester carboxylesterase
VGTVLGERFADLKKIVQPTLVVHGIHDEMIPVENSYALGEHLPNAVLLTYPDSGHGSLFQFHESFTRQAGAFLTSACGESWTAHTIVAIVDMTTP